MRDRDDLCGTHACRKLQSDADSSSVNVESVSEPASKEVASATADLPVEGVGREKEALVQDDRCITILYLHYMYKDHTIVARHGSGKAGRASHWARDRRREGHL